MHPRIDQLLSLRDGEPVDAAAREHVENCAVCALSMRHLSQRQRSLQDLPQFDAPDIAYSRIRARAEVESRPVTVTPRLTVQNRRWASHHRHAVAAAVVVAAVIAGFMAIEGDRKLQALDSTPRSTVTAAAAVDVPQEPPVAQLVEQSRELDQLLQKLPPRPEVQRVSLAGTVDRIEQRVQWLDMQLSSVPETAADDSLSRRMWRERVDLMDSLVAMRYAESLPLLF